MPGESAPTGPDLQHAGVLADAGPVNCVIEFAGKGGAEALVVIFVDTLAVGRFVGIEKTQEQIRIEIIVRSDGLLVGIDLPEEERLNEAPRRHQQVTVIERGAKGKWRNHIAGQIQIALQEGLGNIALVQGLERPHRALILDRHGELRRAIAELPACAVRQVDFKRIFQFPDAVEQGIDRTGASGFRHNPSTIALSLSQNRGAFKGIRRRVCGRYAALGHCAVKLCRVCMVSCQRLLHDIAHHKRRHAGDVGDWLSTYSAATDMPLIS